MSGLTVAVDAGHGGSNEGAEGSTGVLEKDINLATAGHLRKLLEDRGARVLMTRIDDSYSSNTDRLRKVDCLGCGSADQCPCKFYRAWHLIPRRCQGVSTYYRHPCYRLLAETMLDELRGMGLRSFGTIGGFNFLLVAPTELPTVLVEQAFISNPEDEMLLMDDAFRHEIAERIADGLERFLESFEDR